MTETAMNAWAAAYWRSIKRGNRTYESVLDDYKPYVLALAKTDVANGVITEEEYENFIGESYEN